MIQITRASKEEKVLLTRVFDVATRIMGAEIAEADLTMVGRKSIRDLNRDFRGVDRVTDVLSFPTLSGVHLPLKEQDFPFDLDPESGKVNIGSIVICRARAIEQAKEYGHSVTRELAFLTVHGILHLLGFDHIVESDGEIMRAKEKEILSALGIGR